MLSEEWKSSKEESPIAITFFSFNFFYLARDETKPKYKL